MSLRKYKLASFYGAHINRKWVFKIFACLLLSMQVISAPSHSEIYRWVDEQDKVHFGDTEIKGLDQQKVELKVQNSNWKKYDITINDVNNILNKEEIRRIENDVNAVYQFFDEQLYFDFYKTVPVKIRLFEKQIDYHDYLANRGLKNKQRTRGVYIKKTNEIVLPLNSKLRWRTFWTIKHETSHAIVDSATAFLPAWFNEGLAENMESLGYVNNSLILFPHEENWRSTSKAHNPQKKLKVKQFLSTSSVNFYANIKHGYNSHQAHAGELVRMLISSKPGMSLIRRMIHDYKRGSRRYGSYVLEEHYLGGLSTLQQDWNKWVSREGSKRIKLM